MILKNSEAMLHTLCTLCNQNADFIHEEHCFEDKENKTFIEELYMNPTRASNKTALFIHEDIMETL